MSPNATPLTNEERACFEFVGANDLTGLKTHMSLHGIKPNIHDDHGMSILTHACYKGNKEIAQYLIDQGADVNSDGHEHKYTPLHFAALSGNPDLCVVLLDAGARAFSTNSVCKTASQMAGFVGNYRCVTAINNFIPRSDIDQYTVSRAPDKDPPLPPSVATAFYNLIMQVNIHPIRVALNCLPSLVLMLPRLKSILQEMSEKEMKKGAECSEVLSFKLHYIAFVIGEIAKCRRPDKEMSYACEFFIRRILKTGSGDKYMDSLITEAIREFPYKEATIFRQMVTCLAGVPVPPPAFSVVLTILNGARLLNEVRSCATCFEETTVKKCSKCKEVQYCDRECQRLHWFVHKKECNRSQEDLPNKMDSININSND